MLGFKSFHPIFPPRITGILHHQSRAGRPFSIRPLKRTDTTLLSAFLHQLSPETLASRYFVGRIALSETALNAEIERIYRVNKIKGCIVVASIKVEGKDNEEIIGLGEVIPSFELYHTAELGLLVRDDWQGEGVGSTLVQQLVQVARKKGIRTLQAETLGCNRAILRILSKLDLSYSFHTSQNTTTMLALLAP